MITTLDHLVAYHGRACSVVENRKSTRKYGEASGNGSNTSGRYHLVHLGDNKLLVLDRYLDTPLDLPHNTKDYVRCNRGDGGCWQQIVITFSNQLGRWKSQAPRSAATRLCLP